MKQFIPSGIPEKDTSHISQKFPQHSNCIETVFEKLKGQNYVDLEKAFYIYKILSSTRNTDVNNMPIRRYDVKGKVPTYYIQREFIPTVFPVSLKKIKDKYHLKYGGTGKGKNKMPVFDRCLDAKGIKRAIQEWQKLFLMVYPFESLNEIIASIISSTLFHNVVKG